MGQDSKTAAKDERPATARGAGKPRAAKIQGKDRDMGSALRSVYQQTIDEVVPDDLLDLLGKLG